MEQMKQMRLTLLMTVVITVLSVIPITERTPLDNVPLIDKWVHMVMYAALSGAMWLDMKGFRRCLSVTVYLLMLLVPTALGGLLELVQAYLTTCRSGEWLDFVADAIGAAIGSMACYLISLVCQKITSARR